MKVTSIDFAIEIDAPKAKAWELLADFGNPHKYVNGILGTRLVTAAPNGLGAVRHCDLPPMMRMRQYIVEEIIEWNEGDSFTYIVNDTTAPITDGRVQWSVSDSTKGCVIRATVQYRPRYGLLGQLINPFLKTQFRKQMSEGLADMQRILEAPASSKASLHLSNSPRTRQRIEPAIDASMSLDNPPVERSV